MKPALRILVAVIAVAAFCTASAWSQTPVQEERSAAPGNVSASAVKKGVTWVLRATNSPTGTVVVGCGASPHQCDAYHGDTPCTKALPILCIKKTGPGFPLQRPASVNESQYYKWSGGVIGTTKPTVPPTTLAAADALCVAEFGPGWRVADHHDGWGWNFQAFGGVGNPSQRFWININDQPGALCW